MCCTLQCFAASKVGSLETRAAEVLLKLLQPVTQGGNQGCESSALQPQVRQTGVAAYVYAEQAGRRYDQLSQVLATCAPAETVIQMTSSDLLRHLKIRWNAAAVAVVIFQPLSWCVRVHGASKVNLPWTAEESKEGSRREDRCIT